jgi:hypothetical protein
MAAVPLTAALLAQEYSVPKLWPGSTIVCLGDGPSLTREDVDFVRGKARVIAMNYSFRLAPWADVLYTFHTEDVVKNTGVDPATYEGLLVTVNRTDPPPPWPQIQFTGKDGLETDPRGVRHGNNSGYAAINLAVHLGAKRIVLLGYDCMDGEDGAYNFARPNRPDPPHPSRYSLWLLRYKTIVAPLRALGIEVVNASRRTALTVFPQVDLATALKGSRCH